MFRRILIANRGEIAVRIAQTIQQMDMTAIGVYSDPDSNAVHVGACDEAFALEGRTSSETYLRGDKIIAIAQEHAVDAIHPGYGFLSENADFAEACAAAGITFIGPSPEVIRVMGDKIVAKQAMVKAGVPVVPGWSQDAEAGFEALAKEADRIGYPVLVKAAAGGGGKGMRVVARAAELEAGVEAAQREARGAFGDPRVFLEKYIERPRHVEFQIFGDAQGNVVHLFERECSIQRRHQKIVEESPSPALSDALRERMGAAAVRAAQALGYVNAGTVEFLLGPDESFYFLEVNTRLQVEHPVTEWVTGRDLVKAQILVAAGDPMPFDQGGLRQRGHAIECRIYAEDAAAGFLPSTGLILDYAEPAGANIRVDSGVAAGSTVEVYYDPMLAKLTVWGRDREEAIGRMRWALARFVVLGVTTNVDFLQDVVAHPEFVAGRTDTHFVERCGLQTQAAPGQEAILGAALGAAELGRQLRAKGSSGAEESGHAGPWQTAGRWRSTRP
jgi:3-methylcrotonyl-CoA carboxylase alpha subunit